MSTDHAREVAERIARRVSGDAGKTYEGNAPRQSGLSSELASVRAGLNDLQRKIAQLEARLSSETTATDATYENASRSVPLTHSPWLAGVNASISHPSEERFGVDEAVVTQLVDHFEKEKICSLEPGGKPCDHCAMCSSRGF
jgi:hypothetical protein